MEHCLNDMRDLDVVSSYIYLYFDLNLVGIFRVFNRCSSIVLS